MKEPTDTPIGSPARRTERDPARGSQSSTTASGSSADPRPEVPAWILANISDTSKNGSQIYVLYLSFLAYCVLTIFTTSDDQLFLNQSTLLPLVNLNVPSNLFFIFAPLIAIGLFIQLQFYLYHLNKMLHNETRLYAPLKKERLYPSLIMFAEETDRGLVGILQRRVVEISLWWFLPSVLALFAFWTFKRHLIEMSIVLAVLNFAGTLLVVFFWNERHPQRLVGKSLLLLCAVSFQTILLAVLFFSVEPGYPGTRGTDGKKGLAGIAIQTRIGVRRSTAVNLSYRDFSDTKLRTFLMQDLQEVHLEGAELVAVIFPEVTNLSGAYLQSANLEGAQLQKVELSDAHLQEANLSSADLSGACLNGAWLTKSFLGEAKLAKTRLVGAHLQHAVLAGADLHGANLSASDLRQAQLTSKADLTGAFFGHANLEGADLRSAVGLTAEQLNLACTLYNAILDPKLLAEIRATHPNLLAKSKRGQDDDPCSSPAGG